MAHSITLRDMVDDDLEVFFENQIDPEANRMAAFTSKDPGDRDAFDAHWANIRADDEIIIKTIDVDGRTVGSVLSWINDGKREVSYWISRSHWGRGITTTALAEYLAVVKARPIQAHCAKDNVGSLRVLEKCGFEITGEARGFANGRGEEIEEYELTLPG